VSTAIEVSVAADRLLLESSSSPRCVARKGSERVAAGEVTMPLISLSYVRRCCRDDPIFGRENTTLPHQRFECHVQRDGVTVNDVRIRPASFPTRLNPNWLVNSVCIIHAPGGCGKMGSGASSPVQTKSGTNAATWQRCMNIRTRVGLRFWQDNRIMPAKHGENSEHTR